MTTLPVNEAVAGVEAELAAFWATPDVSGGEGHGPAVKVRAATMTFVVVSSHADMERQREACFALSETHAGRSFLLALDGRIAPWEASSDVHAVCRVDGSVPVCYDRVEMIFGAMAAGRAASVVRALALPEVPLVLEAAAGAPSMLVDELAPICDRVIVDSAHMSLARVAELNLRAGGPVADRAWVRTFSWRELCARFFDEAPAATQSIRRVEILRTGGSKVDPAELFLGWLASRIGWSFTSRSSAKDTSGREVEIAAGDVQRTDLPPGVLVSVKISTELGGAPLELAVARTDGPGGRQVRWTMEGARSAAHEHPLGFRDEVWVLRKAIDSIEADKVYSEAVRAGVAWSSA